MGEGGDGESRASESDADADLEGDDNIPLSVFVKSIPHYMEDTDEEFSSDEDADDEPSVDLQGCPEDGDMLDESGNHLCDLTVTKALDLNHSGKKAGKIK